MRDEVLAVYLRIVLQAGKILHTLILPGNGLDWQSVEFFLINFIIIKYIFLTSFLVIVYLNNCHSISVKENIQIYKMIRSGD